MLGRSAIKKSSLFCLARGRSHNKNMFFSRQCKLYLDKQYLTCKWRCTMSADAFWKPFEVEIHDFNGLLNIINQVMEKAVVRNISFAWRGQVNASWALHSSLYRRMNITQKKILQEADITKAEGDILKELHRWGLHSSPHGGRLSVLKQLAMLQHYGAPTRLIDITFNAWVGVWFAVEEKWSNGVLNEEADARLFAFDVTDRLINEKADLRPWEDLYHRPWKSGAINQLDKKEWTTSVYAWKPSMLRCANCSSKRWFSFWRGSRNYQAEW